MMDTNNAASDEDASSRRPLTNPSTRHDSSAVDTGTKISGLEATAAPLPPHSKAEVRRPVGSGFMARRRPWR
jgi:hypothetical protein